MSNTSDVSQQYTFSPSIDLLSVLESLNIQHLVVNNSRALTIFNTTILNLESVEDELTDLSNIEITVYEMPRDTNSTESEALSLIERFVEETTSTEKTAVSIHE